MSKYRTHLIVSLNDGEIIKGLKFPNHSLILHNEPTTCFWESKDVKSYSYYTGGIDRKDVRDNDIPQYELIIQSESEEHTEDLLSIIHGGMLLAYPEPSLTNHFTFITEIDEADETYEKMYLEQSFKNNFKRLENLGFGCQLANVIINEKKSIYALEKYKVSLELSSFTPHSANPIYGQVFKNYDVRHQNHTRSAFAIISAFSVIEELGLEIRSSSKKPRFTDKNKGTWNEKVLKNIEERLEKSGISNDMTFDWIYRGSPTRIEDELKPFFGFDSQWVKYRDDIRDKTLTFPEAIHNASYLRNFIAAHKFNELTQYISPYDVFNIQSLARQLILRKLGLWETMLNRYK
ncbi:hypothetical protein [uncultured Zobellia sp.]|uniref:hypothetical protein n=1 Tax=uncultured Zobellia sp. TaxID=255433 RepID=UPI0025981C83|nr:hypothetical protein [uncultured Zobellia sp.]